MTRSEELFKKAVTLMPGGVNSPVRAFGSVGSTPRFIEQADGVYMTDVDGNKYLDFIGSWGPMILGHNNPLIREAVSRWWASCPTTFRALPPLRARPATWIPRTAFRTSSWRSAMLRRQVRAAVSPVWRPIGPLTIRWPRRSSCSRPIRSTWSTPRVPSASSVRFSPARRSASSTSCRRVRAIR